MSLSLQRELFNLSFHDGLAETGRATETQEGEQDSNREIKAVLNDTFTYLGEFDALLDHCLS